MCFFRELSCGYDRRISSWCRGAAHRCLIEPDTPFRRFSLDGSEGPVALALSAEEVSLNEFCPSVGLFQKGEVHLEKALLRGCGHLPSVVNDSGIHHGKFALEAKLWIVEGAEAPTLVNPGFACSCGACGGFWKGNHRGDALEVDGHLADAFADLRRRCSGRSSEMLVRMLVNIEDPTRLQRRFAYVIVCLETVPSRECAKSITSHPQQVVVAAYSTTTRAGVVRIECLPTSASPTSACLSLQPRWRT